MRFGQPDKLAFPCPRPGCGLMNATRAEQFRRCEPCRRTDGRHALGGQEKAPGRKGLVG